MVDFFLNLTSLLSAILTSVFACYGLLYNYKDKDGKITKQGKRAIIGIVLGGFLSVSSNIIKMQKETSDKLAQKERFEEQVQQQNKLLLKQDSTITGISRVTKNTEKLLYPLSDVRQISFHYKVPESSSAIVRFHNRMASLYAKIKGRNYEINLSDPEFRDVTFQKKGKLAEKNQIIISNNSKFFPKEEKSLFVLNTVEAFNDSVSLNSMPYSYPPDVLFLEKSPLPKFQSLVYFPDDKCYEYIVTRKCGVNYGTMKNREM